MHSHRTDRICYEKYLSFAWRRIGQALVKNRFLIQLQTIIQDIKWQKKDGISKINESRNRIDIYNKNNEIKLKGNKIKRSELSFIRLIFLCSVPVEPSHPSSEWAVQPGAASPE